MRVSLLNVHLILQDAIAQCVITQARFFNGRGDVARIYCMYLPPGAPDDIAAHTRVVDLRDLCDAHFVTSDLYVFHYPGLYPLLDAIGSIDRGSVILYFHNVTPAELWGAEEDADLLRRSRAAVPDLASSVDMIVTPSQFNADDLVAHHQCPRDRIRVLPPAVDLNRFQPAPRDPSLVERYQLEGRRVIVFVGRMAGNKRVDLLVEALPLVRRYVPNAALMLVGDDRSHSSFVENIAGIRSRAETLGVAADVIVTGKVDDLAAHYRLADVYATASLHEGFGVPLIEAMASGVPVVASRATAHPWVLNGAGLLADAGDEGHLARQIVRVLTDEQLRRDLIHRGLARAAECSIHRYEANWAAIVSEVTASPRT